MLAMSQQPCHKPIVAEYCRVTLQWVDSFAVQGGHSPPSGYDPHQPETLKGFTWCCLLYHRSTNQKRWRSGILKQDPSLVKCKIRDHDQHCAKAHHELFHGADATQAFCLVAEILFLLHRHFCSSLAFFPTNPTSFAVSFLRACVLL